jgi:hypothetical protein
MVRQRRTSDLIQERTDAATNGPASRESGAEQPLNRRRALRVLGALAAAAAGAAALSAARPEEASATTFGTLDYTSNDSFATISAADNGYGDGMYGSAAVGNGVEGTTASGQTGVNGPAGVVGWSNATNGVGVLGQAPNGSTAIGVWGQSGQGTGVNGVSSSYIGVAGSSSTSVGVHGVSTSGGGVFGQSGGSGYGVWGNATGNGTGVVGVSSSGIGVEGQGGNIGVLSSGGSFGVYSTASTYGVFGSGGTTGNGLYGGTSTLAGGPAAVQGLNSGGGPGIVGFSGTGTGVGGGTGTGIGFAGIASSTGIGVAGQSASGLSGFFTGGTGVLINGSLTQMNGSKSAAVRHTDGTLRRLYCVESPESWFEDFGSSRLANGSAIVQLEPGFAGVVKTDAYQVFLTPRGEPKGPLYVSSISPSGFTVHEAGGTSSIAFDYRVVAKRKDIAGARLEHVDEPPTIDLSKLAEPPPSPPEPSKPLELPHIPTAPVQHGP